MFKNGRDINGIGCGQQYRQKDGSLNLDGIINIYKEAGFTSHDVVAKLRGILKQKKIGHTGTLDPEATGVLPVCCGKATKVCELLTDKDKSYRAVCRLGVETDTQDMTGTVLNECDTDMITEEQLRDCVKSFVGETEQIPPMYSALKINGKKLYELAREGKTVERKPRKITISEIDIVDINLEEKIFTMDVTCSKGTYIRLTRFSTTKREAKSPAWCPPMPSATINRFSRDPMGFLLA